MNHGKAKDAPHNPVVHNTYWHECTSAKARIKPFCDSVDASLEERNLTNRNDGNMVVLLVEQKSFVIDLWGFKASCRTPLVYSKYKVVIAFRKRHSWGLMRNGKCI